MKREGFVDNIDCVAELVEEPCDVHRSSLLWYDELDLRWGIEMLAQCLESRSQRWSHKHKLNWEEVDENHDEAGLSYHQDRTGEKSDWVEAFHRKNDEKHRDDESNNRNIADQLVFLVIWLNVEVLSLEETFNGC
jgi:hypothetical protein